MAFRVEGPPGMSWPPVAWFSFESEDHPRRTDMAPTHRWMISAAALSLVAGTLGLQETVSPGLPKRDEPQMVLGGIATPGSFSSRDNSVAAQPLTSDQSDKAWFSRARALTADSLEIPIFGVRQRARLDATESAALPIVAAPCGYVLRTFVLPSVA